MWLLARTPSPSRFSALSSEPAQSFRFRCDSWACSHTTHMSTEGSVQNHVPYQNDSRPRTRTPARAASCSPGLRRWLSGRMMISSSVGALDLWMADSKLFNNIQSQSHCLSHLLPPVKHHLVLRPRGHSYAILICPNNLCKCCFIPWFLFCFFLWSMFNLYCTTCAFVTCLL